MIANKLVPPLSSTLRMNPMLQRPSGTRFLVHWGAAFITASASGLASGQETPVEVAASVNSRFELSGHMLVRLDGPDLGPRVEAVGWAERGSNAFGVALGSTLDRPATVPRLGEQASASMDVGVRWRSTVNARHRVDVAAWRALSGEDEERPAVTTRVEMQFAAPRSKSFAELGAVGMQLSGDSRLTLKIRKGRPMFYYRSKF